MTYVPDNYKNYDFFGIRHSRNFLHEKTVHMVAFALAFMLDLSALMVAYSISLPLLDYIGRFFSIPMSENFYATAEIHEVVYFCLSMAILFFFISRAIIRAGFPGGVKFRTSTKLRSLPCLLMFFPTTLLNSAARLFSSLQAG